MGVSVGVLVGVSVGESVGVLVGVLDLPAKFSRLNDLLRAVQSAADSPGYAGYGYGVSSHT